jgi:hypothetical protein
VWLSLGHVTGAGQGGQRLQDRRKVGARLAGPPLAAFRTTLRLGYLCPWR